MKESPESRCRRNAEAWCREIGYPAPPVICYDPLETTRDTCFIAWSQGLEDAIAKVCDPWDMGIRLKDHQPLGYPTALRGYRERRARWAAQPIIHSVGTGLPPSILSIDFDANNPNWGLGPALLHGLFDWGLQKIRGSKTDPFTVARKRGWADA